MDHQGSKIPFRDYRWVGPFIVQKVLPNEDYIVKWLNTNKTQMFHLIRLKKFVPNQPLEDSFREERLRQDDEIIILQCDLYIISWERNFGEQLLHEAILLLKTMHKIRQIGRMISSCPKYPKMMLEMKV